MAVGFIGECEKSQRGSTSKTEVTDLGNWILEVTSITFALFCLLGKVIRSSLPLREGITPEYQEVESKRWGQLGTITEAAYHEGLQPSLQEFYLSLVW